MPIWTPPCRWTMPASSSNSAFMPGCSAIALTIARIRNGSSVSFGRSGALLLVERGAQLLQRGDVDLLDIGDVRDARFGQRHLLRDFAAQPDDLDVLDRGVRRQARLPSPACGPRVRNASMSSCMMRPAGPLPATWRRSTPASRARSRTAGDASGLSPSARGAPMGGSGGAAGAGLRRGRCAACRRGFGRLCPRALGAGSVFGRRGGLASRRRCRRLRLLLA